MLSCSAQNLIKKNSGNAETVVSDSNMARIEAMDSLIRNLVSNKQAAGFSLGIQIGETSPIIREYGLANVEKNLPVKSSDQFRIASVTKPITAAAVLKLVDMGKLSFNDRIDKFFPDYPNGENISVYQLLSHTSGIPNWWEGGMPGNTPASFPMCDSPHIYLQKMGNGSLFKSSEFYKYSNSGYILLGEIIEIVSGRTYDEFLKENIFDIAGMTNTEMEYIERGSERWVTGYALKPDQKMPFVAPDIYHMPFSAGGLRSNAADMLRFVKALRSGKIISKELFNEMTTHAKTKDGKPTYERNYLAPGSEPTKPQENISKRGYGLGFHIMELYQLPAYYHSGGVAGFNSYLIYIPKTNTTIVLLANTEDGIIPILKDIRKLATMFEYQE